MRGSPHWVHIGVLVAVTLVVYANSLLNSFTYDDFPFVINNPIVTHASLKSFFTTTRSGTSFVRFTYATLSLKWVLGITGYFQRCVALPWHYCPRNPRWPFCRSFSFVIGCAAI